MRVYAFCPLSIGAVFFRAPEPRVAIVAKATYTIPNDASRLVQCALASEQDPLRGNEPSRFADLRLRRGQSDADYASDFVPRRARVDVTLAGHAFAEAQATQIRCSVRLGEAYKEFISVSHAPQMEIPLLSESIRDASWGPTSVAPTLPRSLRMAVAAPPRSEEEARLARAWHDVPVGETGLSYQGAPPDQMPWELRLPLKIELTGLVRGGARRSFIIPALAPAVLLWTSDRPLVSTDPVSMRCDSLHIDTDRGRVSLTFRGEAALDLRLPAPEVLVCFLGVGEAPQAAALAATLGAARVFEAATEPSGPDDDESDEPWNVDDASRTISIGDRAATSSLPFRSAASPANVVPASSPVRPPPPSRRYDDEHTAVGPAPKAASPGLPFVSRADSPAGQKSAAPATPKDPRASTRTIAMPAVQSAPDVPESPDLSVLPGGFRLLSREAAYADRTSYLARHESTGVRASVDMMHPSLRRDPRAVARFHREATLRSRIAHPGLQALLDRGELDGVPFLVNAYVEGTPLDVLVAERSGGHMSLDQTLLVLGAGLDMLDALAGANLVHCAIRPGALALVGSKLFLSGLRTVREPLDPTEPDDFATWEPGFMPPEVALGQWDEVCARSDQWALAAVVFWALSGRPVHDAPTRQRALLSAMTRPAPLLSEIAPWVPGALARVVDLALSVRIDDRFASAYEMRNALTAARTADGMGRGPSPAAPERPRAPLTTLSDEESTGLHRAPHRPSPDETATEDGGGDDDRPTPVPDTAKRAPSPGLPFTGSARARDREETTNIISDPRIGVSTLPFRQVPAPPPRSARPDSEPPERDELSGTIAISGAREIGSALPFSKSSSGPPPPIVPAYPSAREMLADIPPPQVGLGAPLGIASFRLGAENRPPSVETVGVRAEVPLAPPREATRAAAGSRNLRPTVLAPEVAAIRVSLWRNPGGRKATLQAKGFDEARWAIAERDLAEAIEREAANPDAGGLDAILHALRWPA